MTLTGLEDQEGRQLDLDDLSHYNNRVLIFSLKSDLEESSDLCYLK